MLCEGMPRTSASARWLMEGDAQRDAWYVLTEWVANVSSASQIAHSLNCAEATGIEAAAALPF